LTSIDYKVLEDNLSIGEIYQVLRLFGAQHLIRYFKNARILDKNESLLMQTIGIDDEIGKDYVGYKCVSRATCEKSGRHICTSNC